MDEKKITDKWVIVLKWYSCQINEHKSCIGDALFFKTFLLDVNVKISKWPLKCVINNRNNVAQKLKEMTDIHPNKIESEKNI